MHICFLSWLYHLLFKGAFQWWTFHRPVRIWSDETQYDIWWNASISYNNNTRLRALFPGLPGWAGTRKEKPIWILLKQETVSGSGIRWAVCKSAPRSRQITTPAPHPVVKVDWRIRWHYTTTTILRLRIGARLTRYRNCKFHNGCRTISRHADGINRYSVPPSAGPLLPLTSAQNFLQAGCPSCCPTNSVKALKAFEMLMHPYLTKILKESYSMVHQMCANFLQHVVFLKELQSGLLLVTGIEMLYLYSLLLIWWCFLYSFTMAIEWIDQPLLCYGISVCDVYFICLHCCFRNFVLVNLIIAIKPFCTWVISCLLLICMYMYFDVSVFLFVSYHFYPKLNQQIAALYLII